MEFSRNGDKNKPVNFKPRIVKYRRVSLGSFDEEDYHPNNTEHNLPDHRPDEIIEKINSTSPNPDVKSSYMKNKDHREGYIHKSDLSNNNLDKKPEQNFQHNEFLPDIASECQVLYLNSPLLIIEQETDEESSNEIDKSYLTSENPPNQTSKSKGFHTNNLNNKSNVEEIALDTFNGTRSANQNYEYLKNIYKNNMNKESSIHSNILPDKDESDSLNGDHGSANSSDIEYPDSDDTVRSQYISSDSEDGKSKKDLRSVGKQLSLIFKTKKTKGLKNVAKPEDVSRWVGSQVQANGGSASSSMSSQTAPVMSGNVKTIPCIVVSPETSDDECQGFDWDDTKKNDEGVMDNSSNQGDNNGGIVDCTTPLMGSTHSQSGGKTMPNIIMSSKDDPKLVWEVKSTDQAYPIIINNSLRKNVLEKQDNVQRTPDSVDDDSNAQTESTTFVQPPPQDIVRRHSIPPNVMDRRNSYTSISDPQRMTSLDIPRKKSRRNSINDMMIRAGSTMNLSRSPSKLNINHGGGNNTDWRSEAKDSLICTLSVLYAKLLFVIGLAFPVADIISGEIPKTLFLGFYLYLYMVSLMFMAYVYFWLLTSTQAYVAILREKLVQLRRMCMRNRPEMDRTSIAPSYKPPKYTYSEHDHGSMYLKLGCVLFGIGAMIFSGLEVGQYFEIEHEPDSDCGNKLLFWVPGLCLLFTFIQMYFIVLNSRVNIKKHCKTARFGLMHMVGTNLCNWVYVLAQETKHTIHKLHDHGNGHGGGHHGQHSSVLGDGHHEPAHHGAGHHGASHGLVEHHQSEDHHGSSEEDDDDYANKFAHSVGAFSNDIIKAVNKTHSRVRRSAAEGCRQGDVIGALVDKAAPFLFPCSIEYSLIGAAVCYIIWKNIGAKEHKEEDDDIDSEVSCYIQKKARHHYSVDCAHASRGLFMGILIMVFTILYLIIVKNAGIQESMRTTSLIIELTVYMISLIATLVGMYQMQELEFERESGVELDIILLIIAQCGVYVYTAFNIIGSSFWKSGANYLAIFTTLFKLIQATTQSIFVLHASRRKCHTPEQEDKKPGREMVIFLLICNLSMWFLNVFKSSHPDEYPTQLEFYGKWGWTIISHVSMPLAIFYRYHVTVCLGEIWKRSYKMKGDW